MGRSLPAGKGNCVSNAFRSTSRKERTPTTPATHKITNNRVLKVDNTKSPECVITFRVTIVQRHVSMTLWRFVPTTRAQSRSSLLLVAASRPLRGKDGQLHPTRLSKSLFPRPAFLKEILPGL